MLLVFFAFCTRSVIFVSRFKKTKTVEPSDETLKRRQSEWIAEDHNNALRRFALEIGGDQKQSKKLGRIYDM